MGRARDGQTMLRARRVNTGAEYWTVCPVPIQRACYATTKRSPTRSPFATYCRWLKPRRASSFIEGAMRPYNILAWAALA
jgi:hypothetical protein